MNVFNGRIVHTWKVLYVIVASLSLAIPFLIGICVGPTLEDGEKTPC